MSTTYRLITGSGRVFTVDQEIFGELAKLGREIAEFQEENAELVRKCRQFQQQIQDVNAGFWRIKKFSDELTQQNAELRKLLREAVECMESMLEWLDSGSKTEHTCRF